MTVSQYDVVTLRNGKRAVVVEILESGVAYLADVSVDNGWDEDDTIFISQEEIKTE